MTDTTDLVLHTQDGLALEAVLESPGSPKACFVFCHPHPQMGGTMNAPLLKAISGGLLERGWAVLRFNFRGIGASEGMSSIGIEEVADAAAAVEEARSRFPTLPLAIGGWSFGASVAGRVAATDDALEAFVGIAPAVTEKPGITAGMPAAEEVDLPMPSLVIVGVNDDLVDPAEARAWAETVGAEFEEMKGANHFFWGKYEVLTERVCDFLERTV
ncbi:MAG: alpha/beta hydrolase [Actinomycetota bacterium]